MLRGSHGGPLAPLADQLNHDRTHHLLTRLAGNDQDARTQLGSGAAPGQLLNKVTDPFTLEVHRPIQLDNPPPGLPILPIYVPREHDHVQPLPRA